MDVDIVLVQLKTLYLECLFFRLLSVLSFMPQDASHVKKIMAHFQNSRTCGLEHTLIFL